MAILNVSVNYLAVFLAAIASMVLGFLWYGPLFGKLWIKLSGCSKKDVEKAKQKGMGKTYFASFVSALVMAFGLAVFISAVGTTNFSEAIIVSFLAWIGFIATTMLGIVLWEGKSVKLYLLNSLYYLVSLEIMAGIIAFM